MARRRRRESSLSWKTWAIVIGVLLVIGRLTDTKDTPKTEQTRAAAVAEESLATATPTPTAKPTRAPTPTAKPTRAPTPTPNPVRSYVLNNNSMIFHDPGCSSVKNMSEKNRQDFEGTRDELLAMGYKACGSCHP